MLVHCVKGTNRSAAMVVALLCFHEGKSLLEAIRIVKNSKKGGELLSNLTFRVQLVDWANELGFDLY